MAKEEVVRFAIGIDLGTTNCCVAAWKHKKIEILENKQGKRTTPSCVSYTEYEELIGDGAKAKSATNPANTVFGIKRLMGRGYRDEFVQQQIKLWPFKVMPGEDGRPLIVVTHNGEERKFYPEEISTMILLHMKEVAELKLGCPVKDAVITVPANFSDSQGRATKNAGEAAGFTVLRILNEPTAAAIAYYLEDASWREGKRNVLVFDLGGGTLDVSILAMEYPYLSIKATAGDTHLGGEDFDDRMLRFLIEEVKKKHGIDVSGIPKALGKMRAECERAKRDLSFEQRTSIDLDYIHRDIESFNYKFTRAKFEDLNMDLFRECIKVVENCLRDANMEKSEIHDVVLAGGSSRIPKMQRLLEELLGEGKLRHTINPDEAIAYGAAVQAAKLVGAGDKRVQDLVVADVTPLSLGTSVSGDRMDVIIPGNTCIPARREKGFFTGSDNITELDFEIREGERRLASLNNLLAKFTFGPFPPARAGDTRVVLGLEVDANGVLSVWAEHRESGLRKDVKITNLHGRIAAQEIGSRIKTAHEHRSEDEQRAEKCWNRYYLTMLVESGRSRIQKAQLLTTACRKNLEDEVNKVDKWLKQNQEAEASVIFKKWEELEKILGQYVDMKGLTTGENKFKPLE